MKLLRRFVAFYAVQFRLLRRWGGGTSALFTKAIMTAAVSVAALLLTAWVMPGIVIRDVVLATIAAVLLATATTLTRPLLIALLSGVSILLTALATVLLQVVAFWLFSRLSVGVEITRAGDAVLGAVVYSLGSAVLTACLSIGDDSSFFGTLVRRLAVHHRGALRTAVPGVVMIQIDGLGYSLLEELMKAGRAPTLADWLRSGRMTLDRWETLLPSQTSASQAGILHGRNDGIPAFRWWDKKSGRLLVSNHPADAKEIMRRISTGDGLLSKGGASIGNLLSGDATRSYLTAATLDDPAREVRRSHVLDWFFISPYSYVRWIALSIGEVLKEIIQARQERLARLEPPGERGFPYPLARAATNVVLRHLTTALVIEEMFRSAPVIYVDYVDYDEIAHHAGPDRVEARDAVAGVDRIIAMIAKAAHDAPRPYRFVVLSDHGQSPGATFEQRYGKTLEALVGDLTGDASVRSAHVENWGPMAMLASEASRLHRVVGTLAGRPFRDTAGGGAAAEEAGDIIVAASGNLALVSFPHVSGRAVRGTIDAMHPGLIDTLAQHPGVGLLMVRTGDSRSVVVGRAGANHLSEDRVEGEDPLLPFGARAASALKRVDAMAECGDLLIVSRFDEDSGAVASFEPQIGSHGGLGGQQVCPFVLHPAEWKIDAPIVGAPAMHAQLAKWLTPESLSEQA